MQCKQFPITFLHRHGRGETRASITHSLTQPCNYILHSAEFDKSALITRTAFTPLPLQFTPKESRRKTDDTHPSYYLRMCIVSGFGSIYLKNQTLRPITPFLWLYSLYKVFSRISIPKFKNFIIFSHFCIFYKKYLVNLCKYTNKNFYILHNKESLPTYQTFCLLFATFQTFLLYLSIISDKKLTTTIYCEP